jgi:twinkle protein
MIDANEINKLLLERAEEVCMHLLPYGKAKGNQWLVGDLSGNAGESLQITMRGGSAGRWIDFANKENKGGTFVWLWAKRTGVNYSTALKDAANWLGLKSTDFGVKRHKPKAYLKPGKAPVRPAEPNCEVMDYLIGERGLDPIVVAKAKVCETEEGEPTIVFPFIEKDPESGAEVCVHRKFLKLARPDGKKDSWTTKGTKRCLYGKNLIDDNVSEIVVCEGEIDCLTWHSWGIPAVSVPNGVSDFEWMDIDWDWLSRFEKIYVSMDMDEHGEPAAQDICKRLGLHRCQIVSLPHKDANDCLRAKMDRESMLKALAESKAIELDEIKRPDDFKNQVVERYLRDPSQDGLETPWYPALPWRVRRGELTILTGFSGHGKTQGLNQLMLHLVMQGCKIMNASLEVRPELTLYYMTRCAMAKKEATEKEARSCVSWLNDNMLFLDCIGTVNSERIKHAMDYAAKRHGVDVIVIDSLFKCGMSGEDYGAARAFVDMLTSFANNTGVHIILVAHSRKTQNGNELKPPTKSDVAGSSDITNAAFNVIVFFRNKLKKFNIDQARQSNNLEELAYWTDQPDGKIIIDKQRFGEGEECDVNTWFDRDSCQFHTTRSRKMPYFQQG